MKPSHFLTTTSLVIFMNLGGCTADQNLGDHASSGGAPAEDAGSTPTPSPNPSSSPSTTDPPSNKPPTNDPPPAKTRTWSTRTPMPTKRTRLSAVHANGKLYAIGGLAFSGRTGTVEIYDAAADSWSTAPAMPTPRYGAAAVVRADGKIVVMGGDYDSGPLAVGRSNVVEIFDPTTGEWTAGPTLPEGRYHGAAAVRADGTIVFAGGLAIPATATRATTFTLAPGAGAWVSGPSMTSPRTSHAMVAGADGTIYAVGGKNNQSDELASMEALAPGALGFATLPAMPKTLSAHAAARGADGKLNIVGGGSGASPLVFDPSTKQWTALTTPPASHLYAAAATAPDGTLFLVGGEAGMALDDVYVLPP